MTRFDGSQAYCGSRRVFARPTAADRRLAWRPATPTSYVSLAAALPAFADRRWRVDGPPDHHPALYV